jgi:hypothetical protein
MNDLGHSFKGGVLSLLAAEDRAKLGGTFLQSYGPSNCTIFVCYDFAVPPAVGVQQSIAAFRTFQSMTLAVPSNITICPNGTALNFPWSVDSVPVEQVGALLSFNSNTVLVWFGVSFHNTEQACANAEAEVPDWNWGGV